jgi:hypothetical protein
MVHPLWKKNMVNSDAKEGAEPSDSADQGPARSPTLKYQPPYYNYSHPDEGESEIESSDEEDAGVSTSVKSTKNLVQRRYRDPTKLRWVSKDGPPTTTDEPKEKKIAAPKAPRERKR